MMMPRVPSAHLRRSSSMAADFVITIHNPARPNITVMTRNPHAAEQLGCGQHGCGSQGAFWPNSLERPCYDAKTQVAR
jgi:hypothetical protein